MGCTYRLDSKWLDSKTILSIIGELTSIQNLIADESFFIAGFQLGKLETELFFLMEALEEKERKGDH